MPPQTSSLRGHSAYKMGVMVILFDTIGIPPHAESLARLINDFDPQLRLIRLPVGHPRLSFQPERPYAVVHGSLPPEGSGYIFDTYPESMLDDRIMRAIIEGSAEKHKWDLDKFDPGMAAKKLLDMRRREDNEEKSLVLNYRDQKRRWE